MNPKLMCLVVLAVGMILLTGTVNAQTPIRVVTVSGGDVHGDFEKQVVAALEARISATTRYALGNPVDAELEASVVCFDVSTLARDITGGVCSFSLYYWPHGLAGLSCLLQAPTLLSSGHALHIGEEVFEAMVNASTEKELAKHLSTMKEAVALYEANKNQNKH